MPGDPRRRSSRASRRGWSAASLWGLLVVVGVGCDSTSSPSAEPRWDLAPVGRPSVPLPTLDCDAVNEENTPKGPARLRFERVLIGMMPQSCGRVLGPSDTIPFAKALQRRLRREPGCEACEINRIDEVVYLDVEVTVGGRWVDVAGERRFAIEPHGPFDPEASPDHQLEGAHFYFNRGTETYEAFLDALCPGSPYDPDAPGPRVVSDDCMELHEIPAPEMYRPGLLEE